MNYFLLSFSGLFTSTHIIYLLSISCIEKNVDIEFLQLGKIIYLALRV
jgi:hypothetical protein